MNTYQIIWDRNDESKNLLRHHGNIYRMNFCVTISIYSDRYDEAKLLIRHHGCLSKGKTSQDFLLRHHGPYVWKTQPLRFVCR